MCVCVYIYILMSLILASPAVSCMSSSSKTIQVR